MNIEKDAAAKLPSPELTGLPELSDQRMREMEAAIFGQIARTRSHARARRRGIWMVGSAAAAVIVVAAVIAPNMPGIIGSAGSSAESTQADAPANGVDLGGGDNDGGSGSTAADEAGRLDGAVEQDAGGAAETDSSARDIIANASATVVVDDVAEASRRIADAAAARDGYVESMSIGQSGMVTQLDPESGVAYDSTSYPYTPDGAWITVRVPAEDLDAVVKELSGVGTVTASSIERYDVTGQTVDLQARIDAAQASVDRLTELMAQAGDLGDLIAAESALAERQATLESYQSELEMLEDQVAMSSVTVTLQPETEVVKADPAGFGDGFMAGWNGLVATLNGIVIALGFLIPWIVVIAVVGVIVWLVLRAVRRRRVAAANVGPVSAPARTDDE